MQLRIQNRRGHGTCGVIGGAGGSALRSNSDRVVLRRSQPEREEEKASPSTQPSRSQPEREEEKASPSTQSSESGGAVDFDELIIVGSAVGFSFLGALAILFLPDLIAQSDQTYYFDSSMTFGDGVGALLWSASYYFVSPLQLLLLFLGRIETTRPSDAVMRLGAQAMGEDTDALGWEPSAALRALAVAGCLVQGVVTALLFELTLGDATWSVSTGIGSLMAAFVYEVGRPKRLSKTEEIALEAVWQDFSSFADASLTKSGRCHESEVFKEFRRRFGRYRDPESLGDPVIRDMIKNWSPNATRTRNGYYSNLSIRSRINDSFG